MKLEIFKYHFWKPLERFGYVHDFFSINAQTIIYTWFVLAILFVAIIVARYFLKKSDGLGNYLIISYGKTFADLCKQILGSFYENHFVFITSLFTFIFLCNCISLIPWLEEPTQDLNTTLALGIVSFFYVHFNAIRTHGIIKYIKEYFSPFILMFPLNVVGKLANIISISFRLFGNIFGGGIIAQIYHQTIEGSVILETIGLISGLNILVTVFFGLFEGFIQAFVFSMLSLTYLSIAIQTDDIGEV